MLFSENLEMFVYKGH